MTARPPAGKGGRSRTAPHPESRLGLESALPDPLRRMIRSGKRPAAVNLWNALNREERRTAARNLVRAGEKGRETLNRTVAEVRNFREATVAKWPESKLLDHLGPRLRMDRTVADQLLHHHLDPASLPMVMRFLDTLKIDHDNGHVRTLRKVDAAPETVDAGVEGIVADYGLRSAAIYLLWLWSNGAPAGRKGVDRLGKLLEDVASSEDGPPLREIAAPVDSAAAQPPDGREKEAERQDDPSRQRSFTTLDRLLILAAVDSAQGIEGSLSPDELDDAVDELAALNGRRHRSYFHSGFRDVLLDRDIAKELPAQNRSRSRWYWTGAVQGWARRAQWDLIVREYDRTDMIRELGSGRDAPSEAAVYHVADALRQQERTEEIAGFVSVRALTRQPRLYLMLLGTASDLLREGDAAGALPIFELLDKTGLELEARDIPGTDRLLLDARRRRAHCLRRLHEHDLARELLEAILRTDPDANIRAMVHADLGLIEAGFDALEEVRLPQRLDELSGILDRLEDGLDGFRKSVGAETQYSAHGHYCMGYLRLDAPCKTVSSKRRNATCREHVQAFLRLVSRPTAGRWWRGLTSTTGSRRRSDSRSASWLTQPTSSARRSHRGHRCRRT